MHAVHDTRIDRAPGLLGLLPDGAWYEPDVAAAVWLLTRLRIGDPNDPRLMDHVRWHPADGLLIDVDALLCEPWSSTQQMLVSAACSFWRPEQNSVAESLGRLASRLDEGQWEDVLTAARLARAEVVLVDVVGIDLWALPQPDLRLVVWDQGVEHQLGEPA